MIIEKEFGKTFDISKNDFVNLPPKTDIEFLEKVRYFQTQIDLLKNKIFALNEMIATGNYSAGEAEVDAIIKEVVTDFEKIKLRAGVIELRISNNEKFFLENFEKIENSLDLINVDELAKKVNKMENTYSSFTGKNSKDIFVSLADVVDILVHRTKNLEIILSNLQEVKLGQKIKEFKSDLSKKEFNEV